MPNNGLRRFSMHTGDESTPSVSGNFAEPRMAGAAARGETASDLDPETVARSYLAQALESSDMPHFARTTPADAPDEFRTLGTETVGVTDSHTVKFRQYHDKVPVYGSLVTVELDRANQLLAINSTLGEPTGVDGVASVAPSRALEVARAAAGYGDKPLEATPRLHYYFDRAGDRWRLVYIVEDVVRNAEATGGAPSPTSGDRSGARRMQMPGRLPDVRDYIVDAHTAELVAELPRTATASPESPLSPSSEPAPRGRVPSTDPSRPKPTTSPSEPVLADKGTDTLDGTGPDELGVSRRFRTARDESGQLVLRDDGRNVHTYDFRFADLRTQRDRLPGGYVGSPPPWGKSAISAHANAAEVADFLANVLRRNGLDNRGERLVSSINCVYGSFGQEWQNAAWVGTQMVYGQRRVEGQLRSYAASLDVVAHEIFHGVTDRTCRLEYAGESGALNESYSDIFGIMISNVGRPNIDEWNWQLGEDLDPQSGVPIRDLADPTKHDQPDHMRDFRVLPIDEWNDWGGVHINSGIHNKAAHLLLTSRDNAGRFLFDLNSAAALFYVALTQHLSRTSTFADSRRGVILAARTIFRNAPEKAARIAAISEAFDKVGIQEGP